MVDRPARRPRALRAMPATGMDAWLASGVPAPLPLALERECGLAADSGQGYLISLGSNEDPQTRIVTALSILVRRHGALVVSRVYSTEAAGDQVGGPRFLNLAAYLRSFLSPAQLKAELQRMEIRLGRQRSADGRPLPVSIDLDILAGPLDQARVLGDDGRALDVPEFMQRPVHELLIALNASRAPVPLAPGPCCELDLNGWRIGQQPVLLRTQGEQRITTAGPLVH